MSLRRGVNRTQSLTLGRLGPHSRRFYAYFLLMCSRFSNRAKSICKEDLVKASQAVDDALLSTRSLISKQESTVIITDPREYQTELFERAKKQNIIAVLDTGEGVH
jgi:hypothetical protein